MSSSRGTRKPTAAARRRGNSPVVRRLAAIALPGALLLVAVLWAGCASTATRWTAPSAPLKEPPPAASDRSYPYRIANDNCNCLEYTIQDPGAKVEYRLQATYRMQTGVLTEIDFTIVNRSDDTLAFDRGAVRVSSNNIRYQYNNKFLPLPWDPVLPRSSGSRKLTGKEVTDKTDWNRIAGEQLTITIKGLALGGRELKSQSVTFVPENPNVGK